MAGISQRL